MCRFALYLGEEILLSSLLTEPDHSLIHQSYQSEEREEPLNGDGFGVSWYAHDVSERPATFKDITPAWNNLNLLNLAPVTKSSCILAHIRAASPGLPVIQLNCHPFTWRHYTFMHNGYLEGFQRYKRALLRDLSDESFELVKGSTDSEHIFGIFVDRLRALERDDPTEAMHIALQQTIESVESYRRQAGIEGSSFLNLAVSDGHAAVVSRFVSDPQEKANTLYVHVGNRFVCRDGVCLMPGDGRGAILIASEPLHDSDDWIGVPNNHMVIVDREREFRFVPVGEF